MSHLHQPPNQARPIPFVRELLGDGFTKAEVEAEEARILRYIALNDRIAQRRAREKRAKLASAADSTQSGLKSKMETHK